MIDNFLYVAIKPRITTLKDPNDLFQRQIQEKKLRCGFHVVLGSRQNFDSRQFVRLHQKSNILCKTYNV